MKGGRVSRDGKEELRHSVKTYLHYTGSCIMLVEVRERRVRNSELTYTHR